MVRQQASEGGYYRTFIVVLGLIDFRVETRGTTFATFTQT